MTKRQAVEARRAWPCQNESAQRKLGTRDQVEGQAPSILGVVGDDEEPAEVELRCGFECSGNTLLMG
jgi:hypothetical protein